MFNTLVHVIMYLYYLLKIFDVPFPWKRWITTLQVVQFVTSFVLFGATLTYLFGGHTRLDGIWDPSPEEVVGIMASRERAGVAGAANAELCAGTNGLAFNVFFNAILLYLFVGVLGSGKRAAKAKKG